MFLSESSHCSLHTPVIKPTSPWGPLLPGGALLLKPCLLVWRTSPWDAPVRMSSFLSPGRLLLGEG